MTAPIMKGIIWPLAWSDMGHVHAAPCNNHRILCKNLHVFLGWQINAVLQQGKLILITYTTPQRTRNTHLGLIFQFNNFEATPLNSEMSAKAFHYKNKTLFLQEVLVIAETD